MYLALKLPAVVQFQVLPESVDVKFSAPSVIAVLTPVLLILACSAAVEVVRPEPTEIVTVDVYLPTTLPMTSVASTGHMPLSAMYSERGILAPDARLTASDACARAM